MCINNKLEDEIMSSNIVQVFITKEEAEKAEAVLKTEKGYTNRQNLLDEIARIEKKK